MNGILWFDCDGVLADFAGHFRRTFGKDPAEFRADLGESFYATLPTLPGSQTMVAEMARNRPFCLTALPPEIGESYLKRDWLNRHFPALPVVEARRKAVYCRPGDVLVDDSPRHDSPWRTAGGTFILHKDPADTLARLRRVYG